MVKKRTTFFILFCNGIRVEKIERKEKVLGFNKIKTFML